jgi:DNA repair protein RadA/Sms
MSERLPTGLSALDWKLGGGLLTKQLYAFVSPADSQSELLLELFAATKPAHIVSTLRPAAEIRAELDWVGVPDDAVTVSDCSAEELAADPERWLTPPEGGYLVLDPFDTVENEVGGASLHVLDAMRRAVDERNAVGLVHCLEEPTQSYQRRLTLKRVDGVMRLDVRTTTQSIETRLLVTKYRRGRAEIEPIKLRLTDHVTLDTSRDIA